MPAQTMENNSDPVKPRLTASLLSTLVSAWVGSLCMGVTLGYSSPAAESLAAATGAGAESFQAVSESIWLSHLLPAGAIPGAFLCAVVSQSMGRRVGLMLSSVLFMLGYAVIFFAGSGVLLLCGRFVTGVATGAVSLCVPAYIAEITAPTHRGTMGGVLQLAITIGIMLSYTVGRFVDWRTLGAVCFLCSVVQVGAGHFSVESPRWLVLRGRRQAAMAALGRLRGPQGRVMLRICSEVVLILLTAAYALPSSLNTSRRILICCDEFERSITSVPGTLFLLLSSIAVSSSVMVKTEAECRAIEEVFALAPAPTSHTLFALHAHFIQQFSGINMVIFYARSFFADAGIAITATDCSIVIAGIQVAATMVVVSVMDVVGRRRLLAASSFICVAAMVAIAALYNISSGKGEAHGPSIVQRLPILFLGLYIVGYSVGLGPVVWILLAELVPLRHRGLRFGSVVAFNWACAGGVTWFFNSVRESFQFSGLGWFFSSVTFVGGTLVAIFLPETRCQSLEDILQSRFKDIDEEYGQSSKTSFNVRK
ncbi:trehalose transporter 1-like protein [Haemaphysalis longicornis]